jgi:hypothetical protein
LTIVGQSLPQRFPIFPLRGALLLPGGALPLHIFEPRYVRMVRDAMVTDRVIGMIQPVQDDDRAAKPKLFRTGCVGRISNFGEIEGSDRYRITLTGAMRFDVAEELSVTTPYRQVIASFDRWRGDLQPATPPAELRGRLLHVLDGYLERHGIKADRKEILKAPLVPLVVSLAMVCPFAASEKQALLEADDVAKQGELLVALMEMDALARDPATSRAH